MNENANGVPQSLQPSRISAITPSDSVEFAMPVLVYATGAGNIAFDAWSSGTATIAVEAGTYLLDGILVKKVYATGTTATGLYAII